MGLGINFANMCCRLQTQNSWTLTVKEVKHDHELLNYFVGFNLLFSIFMTSQTRLIRNNFCCCGFVLVQLCFELRIQLLKKNKKQKQYRLRVLKTLRQSRFRVYIHKVRKLEPTQKGSALNHLYWNKIEN